MNNSNMNYSFLFEITFLDTILLRSLSKQKRKKIELSPFIVFSENTLDDLQISFKKYRLIIYNLKNVSE